MTEYSSSNTHVDALLFLQVPCSLKHDVSSSSKTRHVNRIRLFSLIDEQPGIFIQSSCLLFKQAFSMTSLHQPDTVCLDN